MVSIGGRQAGSRTVLVAVFEFIPYYLPSHVNPLVVPLGFFEIIKLVMGMYIELANGSIKTR